MARITKRKNQDKQAGQTSGQTSGPAAQPEAQKPSVQKPSVQKPAVQKPAIQKPAVQKPAIGLIWISGAALLIGLAGLGLAINQYLNPPIPGWQAGNRAEMDRLAAENQQLASHLEQLQQQASQIAGANQELGETVAGLRAMADSQAASLSELGQRLADLNADIEKRPAPGSQGAAGPAMPAASQLLLAEMWLAGRTGADLTLLAGLMRQESDPLAIEVTALLDRHPAAALASHARLLAEGSQLVAAPSAPASGAQQLFEGIWQKLADMVQLRQLATPDGPIAAGQAEFSQIAKNGNLVAAVDLLANSEALANSQMLDSPSVQRWLADARARIALDAAIAALYRHQASPDGQK